MRLLPHTGAGGGPALPAPLHATMSTASSNLFTGPSATGAPSASDLHAQYRGLLAHERMGIQLERQLWESERAGYTSRIRALESEVQTLRRQGHEQQLQAPCSSSSPPAVVVAGSPDTTAPHAMMRHKPPPLSLSPQPYQPPIERRVEPDEAAQLLAAARRVVGSVQHQAKGGSEKDDEEERVPLVLKKTTNFGEAFGSTWNRPRWGD